MLKKYNFYIHILIILVFSLGIRIFLLSKSGPIYSGDSEEYIEVVKNISNGYGFSKIDIANGQMKPYSNKPPLFFYTSSLLHKILNGKLENDIIILNLLSSILTLLLWLYITYLITKNKKITIITGWILSINPNLIYNSLTIMSDTFYLLTFSLFVLFFILSIKKKNKYLFFISGISMGISVLTRTVLKAFWIFGIILIILVLKDEIKKKIKYSLLFLAGHLLIVLPYHIRNQLKFMSPSIDFHQGTNISCLILPLIDKTNYDSLIKEYPMTYKIIELSKHHEDGPPENVIKLTLKLNNIELSRYLTLITLYTIKENPLQYLELYIKNAINITTSSSSYLLVIDIFKNGFYDKQHKIFKEFILDKTKKDLKEVLIILPNLFFRFINLIIFLYFICGIFLTYKNELNNKEITIFITILFLYTLSVSSLVVGYDRYRLPLEPLIIMYFIYKLFNTKFNFLNGNGTN
jgi:4-amino-4-deoxy-L-arabinose transferase-like glycosyltransferase